MGLPGGDGYGFVGRFGFRRAIGAWLDERPSGYFVLGGAAGSGKTTALRWLKDSESRITASHFCDPTDLTTRDPLLAAERLASQLSHNVPGFLDALLAANSSHSTIVQGGAHAGSVEPGGWNVGVLVQKLVVNAGSAESGWNRLVGKPLEALSQAARTEIVILVDALDEADQYDGLTKLTHLILGMGADEDSGVRFVVSTRYPDKLIRRAAPRRTDTWNLSGGTGLDETHADIKALFATGLARLNQRGMLHSSDDLDALVDTATERSEGNFLYASLLLNSLEHLRAPFGLTDVAAVPHGLDSFLYRYLTRIVDGDNQTTWLTGYQPVLSVLNVAQEPVDETAIGALSGAGLVTVGHVIGRLEPLLRTDPGGDISNRRHALYHAALRDFLGTRDRSLELWCPPEEGHVRIVDVYRERTQGWAHWGDLDEYGFRNLLTHARAAGWGPTQLASLLTPAFVEEISHRGGNPAVVRQLEIPIALAVERGDVRYAFRWCWAARLLRRGMNESLSAETPVLLVKTGRAAAAIEALGAIDATEWQQTQLLRALVEALGTELQPELGRDVVRRGASAQQGMLLLRLARGLARYQPDAAVPVVEDALKELREHRFESDLAELAIELARHPGHVKRAFELARIAGQGASAVIDAVTGHNLEVAAALAGKTESASDFALVCDRAAGRNPQLARQMWQGIASHLDAWWRATIALARHGELPSPPDKTLGLSDAHDGVGYALFVAAAGAAYPRENLAALKQRAEELLELYPQWYSFRALDDCRLLGELDLAFLSGIPPESRDLASRAAQTAIQGVLGDPDRYLFMGEENAVLGRACGSIACFDPGLAKELFAKITEHRDVTRNVDASKVRQALVSRLTPVDPQQAWQAFQSDNHFVYRAWVEALPFEAIGLGITRIAAIDRRYSRTRSELAGALAMKLPPGGGPDAESLLRLLVHPLDSETYLGERAIAAAADHGLNGDAAWAERLVREVAARVRGNLAQRLHLELVNGYITGVEKLHDIGVVAAWVVAKVSRTSPGAALFCHLAAEAADRGMPKLAARLAQEALHPVYRPVSVHVAKWPRHRLAFEVARQIWPQDGPATLDELIYRFSPVRHDAHVVISLLDFFGRFPLQLEFIELWNESTVLEEFRRGARGEPELELDVPPGVRARAAVLKQRLIALASQDPETAIRLVTTPPPDSVLEEMVETYDQGGSLFVSVVSAVADYDPEKATAACHARRERDENSVLASDGLQSVAFVQSLRDWWGALELVRRLDFQGVRGRAFADLAAVAARLSTPEERAEAYNAILDSLDVAAGGSEYLVDGLLEALVADPAPMEAVVARLVPTALSSTFDDRSILAGMAAVVDSTVGLRTVREELDTVETLINAAWRV